MTRWGYRLYYLNEAGEPLAEQGLGSPNEMQAAIDGARRANESRARFASWRVVRYEQTERTIAEGIHIPPPIPPVIEFDERKAMRTEDSGWYPDDRD